MSLASDERARIIAGFSAKERARYEQMGGSVPAVAAPEPQWWRPGIDKLAGFQPQTHECTVKVKLDNGPAVTIREAAFFLGVGEQHIRKKLKGSECVVRGVKVKRVGRGKAA